MNSDVCFPSDKINSKVFFILLLFKKFYGYVFSLEFYFEWKKIFIWQNLHRQTHEPKTQPITIFKCTAFNSAHGLN